MVATVSNKLMCKIWEINIWVSILFQYLAYYYLHKLSKSIPGISRQREQHVQKLENMEECSVFGDC